MTTILCATRGGEASYPTQDKAIALAQERNADLLFIYVTDVQFLNRLASPILVDIEAEMEGLAEFLLLMAKERAEKAGVKADAIVRRGIFRAALEKAAQEHAVSLVVLGSPAGKTSITREEYLEGLAEDIWTDTGIETVVVSGGEIVVHYGAGQSTSYKGLP